MKRKNCPPGVIVCPRTRNRNRMLELRDFVETNNRHIADLISSKLLEDYDEADGM